MDGESDGLRILPEQKGNAVDFADAFDEPVQARSSFALLVMSHDEECENCLNVLSCVRFEVCERVPRREYFFHDRPHGFATCRPASSCRTVSDTMRLC